MYFDECVLYFIFVNRILTKMNTRIKEIMDHRGLTPSEFADAIGVQRSNVTHILHGRNKPGFQFIAKILETFPEINAKWLITGEGNQLEEGRQEVPFKQSGKQKLLFQDAEPGEKKTEGKIENPKKNEASEEKEQISEQVFPVINEGGRKIERIVVFFTDQTFRQYLPSR